MADPAESLPQDPLPATTDWRVRQSPSGAEGEQTPEVFWLPFLIGMEIHVDIQFLPPVMEAPAQGVLTALSAKGMLFEVNRLLMKNTHVEVGWTMPQKGFFKCTAKITEVKKLDSAKYQVGVAFGQAQEALAGWVKPMIKDYQMCDQRIGARKGTVCVPDCHFMRYCTKPQRKDFEKGPVFEVIGPDTPAVATITAEKAIAPSPSPLPLPATTTSAGPPRLSGGKGERDDFLASSPPGGGEDTGEGAKNVPASVASLPVPQRRWGKWVAAAGALGVLGVVVVLAMSKNVRIPWIEKIPTFRAKTTAPAPAQTLPSVTPEELQRAVQWAKSYRLRPKSPRLETAVAWKLKMYKQKDMLSAMRTGARSLLPQAAQWMPRKDGEDRYTVTVIFSSLDPAKNMVYSFGVSPGMGTIDIPQNMQAEFLDTLGTSAPAYSAGVSDAFRILGQAEAVQRLEKQGADAKRLSAARKLLTRHKQAFSKTHGAPSLAHLEKAYRL